MARSYRSAITGRYISKSAAGRHPKTTVSHGSKGSKALGYRSVITGRSVTAATVKRHPDTTITEG